MGQTVEQEFIKVPSPSFKWVIACKKWLVKLKCIKSSLLETYFVHWNAIVEKKPTNCDEKNVDYENGKYLNI